MSNFKEADTRTQWFYDNYPGSPLNLGPKTMVVVLHTTEGFSWPSYSGGATSPNYTGLAPLKGISSGKWRAHHPDERSSRALRNDSGGVETNTLNAEQIELIGTCDPRNSRTWYGKTAGKDYIFWPEATDGQLDFVAELLADFHKRHGLRLVAPQPFRAYPGSYGEDNPNRLTFSEWRNAVGVVGHQHVPENSHGDPGNIDIDRILSLAKKRVA